MPAICLYFQVHQPYRLRNYTVFDLGCDHLYENADMNRSVMRKVAERSYLPANALLLELITKYKGKFKVNFSISGTALDQFEEFAPDVLEGFKTLAATGCVEFLAETDNHSLAFIYARDEFRKQVQQHHARIERLFGVSPTTFRNTELIYNNDLAQCAEEMGYSTILTEGADHILGWRSPNFVYQPVHCHKLRLLMRNYQLSDDIAFRFSDTSWADYPLTADTYASWLHSVTGAGEVINLFMDYETLGEHHGEASGIFEFVRALPGEVFKHPDFCFRTIANAAENYQPVAKIDVPQYISWADAERDLTAWLGNDMQLDAIESLYRLEPRIETLTNPDLLRVWRRMQTSDHFYYMSTKWFSDGDVHSYFNPYGSPYDAYINFMNVLADFELTLKDATHHVSLEAPSATGGPSEPATPVPTKPATKATAKTPARVTTKAVDKTDKATAKTPATANAKSATSAAKKTSTPRRRRTPTNAEV